MSEPVMDRVAMLRAVEGVASHYNAWVRLFEAYVALLPHDRLPSGGEDDYGCADRSYAEHELRALKRDLPALLTGLRDGTIGPVMEARDQRQATVAGWVRAAFGDETMCRPDQRAARVLEEAAELAQALGVPRATADRVVDYVYARPVGEPAQEVGGVLA